MKIVDTSTELVVKVVVSNRTGQQLLRYAGVKNVLAAEAAAAGYDYLGSKECLQLTAQHAGRKTGVELRFVERVDRQPDCKVLFAFLHDLENYL